MVDIRPYAQALFEIASENKEDEKIKLALKDLADLWEQNPEWVALLRHPKVKREEKKQMMDQVLSDSIPDVLLRFLSVCNKQDVVSYLPEIYQAYLKIYNDENAIEWVDVESASALDEIQENQLKAVLAKKLNKTIQLNIKVNPALIAGLRIKTSEFVLDNTILSKADSMKEKIKKN